MVTTWDSLDPLAADDGETTKANQALRDYALLGSGRSLKKLCQKYEQLRQAGSDQPPTTRLPTLEQWSKENKWQARVADYDRLLFLERDNLRRRRFQEWEDRSWTVANDLMGKAEQMLKFPLVETVTRDGQTTVSPARWSLDTVSRLTTTADKLARASTGNAEGEPDDLDWLRNLPDGLTPDDLDLIIEEWAAQMMGAAEEFLNPLEPEEDHDDEPE